MLILSWPVETQQASELAVAGMQPSLYLGNVRALDRAKDHESGFGVGDRLVVLSDLLVLIGAVDQRVALAAPVADLARERG